VNLLQFLNAAHISTLNCVEMAGDTVRQLKRDHIFILTLSTFYLPVVT